MRYKHRGHTHNNSSIAAKLEPDKLETLLYGAPLPDAVYAETKQRERDAYSLVRQQEVQAQRVLRAQQKEDADMSALRDSLEKAIAEKQARAAKLQATMDDWSEDEPVNAKPTAVITTPTKDIKDTMTYTPKTVSFSEGTFNYVKAHPYTTKAEAVEALAKEGYNIASTVSLISHMIRQRLVSSDANGKLTAIVKAYTPLKATPKITGRKPTVQPSRTEHKQVRITVNDEDVAPRSGGIPMLVKPAPTREAKTESLLNSLSVMEARALYLELKSMFGGN